MAEGNGRRSVAEVTSNPGDMGGKTKLEALLAR